MKDSEIPSEKAEENKDHSGDNEREPGKRNKDGQSAHITALIDARSRQSDADREERRRQDRGKCFREWATIVLLFLAFAATVIQAIIFHGQLDEMRKAYEPISQQASAASGQLTVMQGQLREMQAEQRPWIYADIGPGGKIFRNQSGGLTFQVVFTFHNTGHLPAMYVSPDIEGYLSGESGVVGSQTVRERQQKRCGRPLQQPNAPDQIGVTVFPGQSILFGTGIGITADEIDEVRKLDQKIGGTVLDFFPSPWGTGCIRYRSPDGAFHQTGVAFTISMIKPGKDGVWALPADPTSIDPKNLVIQPWIAGGTAYAN